MAPPCCSVFRPFYNIQWLPEDIQQGHALYRERDQWWTFIELERYIALNYDKFAPKAKEVFGQMEDRFLQEAEHIETSYTGNVQILKEFSDRAAKESVETARGLIREIKGKLKTEDIDRMLLSYFIQASDGCGMSYNREIIK